MTSKLNIWREIFREAARKLEFANVELDDNGSCTLRPQQPGLPPVNIVYDDENGLVDICAELGVVPDADPGVYRELLFDNLFAEATRGATYAASRTSGQIVLQRVFKVESADDGEALAQALVEFAETAFAGRRLIYRSVLGGAPNESSSPTVDESGFLKV